MLWQPEQTLPALGQTVSPKYYVKVLTLRPQNGTLFRNRVDEDVISQNEVTVECAPNPMTGVLIKGKSDTHTGKRSCKDWSDTATAEELTEAGGSLEQVLPQHMWREHGPADMFISHFWPLGL